MDYILEERECQCPEKCGKKFKVLPTSQAKYFASSHDPNFVNKPIDHVDFMNAKRKSQKLYRENLTLTDEDE